jgi:hypothetical protein
VEGEDANSGALSQRGWYGACKQVLVKLDSVELDASEFGDISGDLVLVESEVLEESKSANACRQGALKSISCKTNCSDPSEVRNRVWDSTSETKPVQNELDNLVIFANDTRESVLASMSEVARVLSPGLSSRQGLNIGGFVEIAEEVLFAMGAGTSEEA